VQPVLAIWKQLATTPVVEQEAVALVVAVAGTTLPEAQAEQVVPPRHVAQLPTYKVVLPGYKQTTHALLTGVVAYPMVLLQAEQVAVEPVVGVVQVVHPRTPVKPLVLTVPQA